MGFSRRFAALGRRCVAASSPPPCRRCAPPPRRRRLFWPPLLRFRWLFLAPLGARHVAALPPPCRRYAAAASPPPPLRRRRFAIGRRSGIATSLFRLRLHSRLFDVEVARSVFGSSALLGIRRRLPFGHALCIVARFRFDASWRSSAAARLVARARRLVLSRLSAPAPLSPGSVSFVALLFRRVSRRSGGWFAATLRCATLRCASLRCSPFWLRFAGG